MNRRKHHLNYVSVSGLSNSIIDNDQIKEEEEVTWKTKASKFLVNPYYNVVLLLTNMSVTLYGIYAFAN